MTADRDNRECIESARVCAYAIAALPVGEAAEVEAHVALCSRCAKELEGLRATVDAFATWPTDVLRPSPGLQQRLAQRIASEAGGDAVVPPAQWTEPAWDEVSPGIHVKLLANDVDRHRVSMLVRLEPGVPYPPHTHADIEELHLLDGELWIEDRKLYPGDYNRATAPTADSRVVSDTGCTCVLITSTRDALA
jgi:anti-sigma factor ChrR (cupin superfamily)